jgi:hypothetical protein
MCLVICRDCLFRDGPVGADLEPVAGRPVPDFGRLPGSGYQRIGGRQARRLGYMTEQMFGYSLAVCADLRGQSEPPWTRYLDTNPRVYMEHGTRRLRASHRVR